MFYFQVQSMSSGYATVKAECEITKERLKEETQRKHIAESNYKMLCDEKGGGGILVKFLCVSLEDHNYQTSLL